MKKIEIMGCGYIGLPTAVTFTLAGYTVCGFDINPAVVASLNAGHIHIVEPGLQEALEQALATGRLHFADSPEPADVFIIAVQTPWKETADGRRVSDMKYVESAAEMCKLTENTFRDINIAYANELSKVCDRLGIDVFNLIELANCHPRVNVHSPGVGVGGHCIAVDPWFIHEKFEDITPLIYTARTINDGKPQWVLERIGRDVAPGAKIAVLGMSFKANIDDTRESPSVILAQLLQQAGYTVLACEPNIQGPVAGFENYTLEAAMAGCDYAVITLAHDAFRSRKDLLATKPYYDCVGLMR